MCAVAVVGTWITVPLGFRGSVRGQAGEVSLG